MKPDIAHSEGLSDHAILRVGVSLQAPPNPDTMPIRAEVFKHERFQIRLKALYRDVRLEDLPTWERWETHKLLLRDAALHARDEMLLKEKDSDFCYPINHCNFIEGHYEQRYQTC